MSELSKFLATIPEFTKTSRLQSLYSDISRQKVSNPTGYQANVLWWKTLLQDIVKRGLQSTSDHFVLHVDSDLIESLRWGKVGRPLSMPSVVSDLKATRDFIPLDDFLSSSSSVHATYPLPYRVASLVLGRPLWWALEQLNIVGESENPGSYDSRWALSQGSYVVLDVLEVAAEAIIKAQLGTGSLSLSESTHNLSSFRTKFAPIILPRAPESLTDLDIQVLLRYLERDKGALVSEKEVIKFAEPNSVLTEITDVDRGVAEMKLTRLHLQEQVDEIQRKIEDRVTKIKDLILSKRQEMAKSYLRSKKLLEELLVNRLKSLETIQTILLKLDTAAGDIEASHLILFSPPHSGLDNLPDNAHTLLAHPTLQRDYVDATLANISDALANHAEIEQAIQLGGKDAQRAANVDFDDDELDVELAEMVQAQQAEGVIHAPQLERLEEDEGRGHVKAALSQIQVPLHSPFPSSQSAPPIRHRDAQLE
ncbi:hypothetical protein BS47DRAFT_1387120 [Hydnum rufescens UP504]|uniref:Snf7-domain-containing protein n=1 Tax=Hydnum rufescens UP504 TaxID=1448309 RepID=A0A9P6BBP6_9AGAM|nr:hypothetical protein BS47DRAFT_1387120 [Hydnum rufescens UP504]